MANINGIIGYHRQQSVNNKLLAAFGNDIVDIATGLGNKLNLTPTSKVEFANFIDKVYATNYTELPIAYDGTSWSRDDTIRIPQARYIKKFKDRLYLGNTKIIAKTTTPGEVTTWTYPSRVFYSDLPIQGIGSGDTPVKNKLTWGISFGGSELNTFRDSPIVVLTAPRNYINFIEQNIKIDDPIIIPNEDSMYKVKSIDSAYRLTLNQNLKYTDVTVGFWVGGNWFDVGTDDGDQVMGFGENSDRLLIFKLMSLHFYTGSQLRQIKDSVGTSSQRSIINYGGYTYYFHGSDPSISGIYRYDGVSSVRVSKAIDPFIQGMDTSNYTEVVAWAEGEELRFFIGDLTNTNRNISMPKAVATYHTAARAWDVSPIADTITCSTIYRTNNRQDTYNGNSEGQVLKMHSGYNHNGDPIRMILEKEANYPSGSETINEFTALQVIGRSTNGVKLKYKLRNKPNTVDDNWQSLGELKDDKNELIIPRNHNTSAGVDLQFSEDGILENDTYIEKATLFYRPTQTRMIK